jgi:hypothetical protein
VRVSEVFEKKVEAACGHVIIALAPLALALMGRDRRDRNLHDASPHSTIRYCLSHLHRTFREAPTNLT